MKNHSFAILLFTSFHVPTMAVERETIRIISPAAPPIIYFDEKTKTAAGYLFEHWKNHVEPKIGLKTTWLPPIPGDRILEQMNDKKIDLGISAKNTARFPESLVEYSPTPIYQASQLIIGRTIWPKGQEKTVLVSADTLLPRELLNETQYKIVKIYGLDQSKRIVELLEQKRAWGFYGPIHWTGTMELLKRQKLVDFSPYHLSGHPKRDFYIFASKKMDPKLRQKIFQSLNPLEIQQSIDRLLNEACHKVDHKNCSDFLDKLK